MSVVNKMLQDLESRQQQPQTGADYQPPAKKRYGWWIVGVLPLALIMAALYWLWPVIWDVTGPTQLSRLATQKMQSQPVQSSPQTGTDKATEKSSAKTEAAAIASQQPEIQQHQTPPPATEQTATRVSEEITSSQSAESAEDRDTGNALRVAQKDPEPETPAQKPPVFSKTNAATTTEQRWQQLTAEVSSAMADNRHTQAIAGLEQMLELQPDNHQVRRNLAALLLKSGALSRSELLLEQGVARYPQALSLVRTLARLYHQNSQTDKALALLKNHNPDVLLHPDYIQLRARLAQQQQDHKQAQQDYALLSRYQPSNIKWRLGLAVSLDQDGQYQAAIEVYQWLAGADVPAHIGNFVQQRLTALGG